MVIGRTGIGVLGTLGIVCAIAWAEASSGESVPAPTSSLASLTNSQNTYDAVVLPVLTKNCYGCHNEKLNTANLNLQAFGDGAAAIKDKAVWTKVLAKLDAGQMPPRGMPAPSATESKAVTSWIRDLLGKPAPASAPDGDPGRVTARRLNREEYNNTVRDLLGLHTKPADEFPVDDAGYGFDNNGDVLTLSPLLMEKYISAARRLSRLAVYGETLPPKPTLMAAFAPKKGQDEPLNASSSIVLPYSMRGSMYASYVFPVTGDYEFRVRIINHRDANGVDYNAPKDQFLASLEAARRGPPGEQEGASTAGGGGGGRVAKAPGQAKRKPPTPEELKDREEKARLAFPPVKMVLTLDGKEIAEDSIEGNTTYKYDRGPVITRVHVTAGEHYIRGSFPDLADLDDPRRNINPDGRRRMYIEFAELAGPYSPSVDPPESRKKIFVCADHTPACARRIVENLSQRAYRRPVSPQEVDQLAGLVALARRQGDSFDEGVRLAVQAVLMSPSFLFRTEMDPKSSPATVQPPHQITDYELASRLSYFLWSSMPDDELFGLAKQEKLRQPDVLAAQVNRMMADPKADALVQDFAGQWLGIRNLDRKPPDSGRFETTDDELLGYMHRETTMFVSTIFRENRSILDFIDAPFSYLNEPLAKHYDIDGVKGEEFRRVDLTGDQRSGVLTQGAIMIVSAYPTRTSVVTRGKWVLENFLGSAPPPPPPDVPALKESDIGASASLREKMEQHRANPACAVCHLQMDPIGFSLENYDAAGEWRTHDGKFPIDASGTLPDGKHFNGAKELKEVLRSKCGPFAENFTDKLMTYALGRGVEQSDRSTVNEIVADGAAHDYRFSTLVMDIVKSKPFHMRSPEGVKQ